MEDKKTFVAKFGELLALTREGVVSASYKQSKNGSEYMYIHYNSGATKKINISGSSEHAIIGDYCRQITDAPWVLHEED